MSNQPTFWGTVRLLLGAARRRSVGRQKRQQELLAQRSGKDATDWGILGVLLGILFMAVIHGLAASSVITAVDTSERLDTVLYGSTLVSDIFFEEAGTAESGDTPKTKARREAFLRSICAEEAARIAARTGGDRSEIESRLLDSVEKHGTSRLISQSPLSPRFDSPQSNRPLAAMFGSMVLLLWLIMMVFQGEGLELDLQRRRSPMWEWLLSHPAPPGAIFLAEMLSPLAANPIYWSAPLFAGILYGMIYGPALGLLAALLIGVPVTVATACLGKAVGIAVILRVGPRSRGAVAGLMSWAGYATMMLFLVGYSVLPKLIPSTLSFLLPLAKLPWPWLALFIGGPYGGSYSFHLGMIACWTAAALTLAISVWLSVWATEEGLSGNSGAAAAGPATIAAGQAHFARLPLYRKETLWFLRDRSAIVQTILIPITIASVQLFNMRGLIVHAQRNWNYLSGGAIFFGTYFLWILGPKSLASEGNALWIALTWPMGLEALLKAKAWLWSLISTAMVVLVLGYAVFLFPAAYWKIALVAIAWYFFGRSMAEKAVTLVTVPSESGETQKIPSGRRWAAQLGMLTFAIGVITEQWHVAMMGIVYSYITAAAMWQNFRARLPYLYDPWSEELPPPPTLMHAMISISILVEGGAVVTGILLAIAGPENIAIAQAIAYAICSVAVALGTINFLDNRNVSLHDVLRWRSPAIAVPQILPALILAAVGGIALGLVAHGYLALLTHIPATAEVLRKSQEAAAKVRDLQISYAVMAVAFAPFAEEYLFRGLLFRALDREWGGWRAVVGSAAFFAVYHPALSWPPVFLLGVCNALIFKKSGRLGPAILLHMIYNGVVAT